MIFLHISIFFVLYWKDSLSKTSFISTKLNYLTAENFSNAVNKYVLGGNRVNSKLEKSNAHEFFLEIQRSVRVVIPLSGAINRKCLNSMQKQDTKRSRSATRPRLCNNSNWPFGVRIARGTTPHRRRAHQRHAGIDLTPALTPAAPQQIANVCINVTISRLSIVKEDIFLRLQTQIKWLIKRFYF